MFSFWIKSCMEDGTQLYFTSSSKMSQILLFHIRCLDVPNHFTTQIKGIQIGSCQPLGDILNHSIHGLNDFNCVLPDHHFLKKTPPNQSPELERGTNGYDPGQERFSELIVGPIVSKPINHPLFHHHVIIFH